MSMRTTTAAALAAAMLLVTGTAVPATAGAERIQRGSCEGPTTYKLKVKSDNGALEVDAEIDSNRNGQRWRWRILHNGSVSARGRNITHGASGSFSVSRRMSNLAGTDRFRLRAHHGRHSCNGRIRW